MEIWKEIPGYEGYYAGSSLGRVKSLDRIIDHALSGRIKLKGRILKPARDKKGNLSVALCKDNQPITWYVNLIVAGLFIANPENKEIVRHKNNDLSDNRVENLEYCDRSDVNIPGNVKLDLHEALTIKSLKGKVPAAILRNIFHVSDSCVRRIFNNQRWVVK